MNIGRRALVLGAGLLLLPGFCPAKSGKIEDIVAKVRDQKKQVVAANLPLTGDEATKFWPVYGIYTLETIKVNDVRYGLVKEYAANYTMTDAQAASYIRRWTSVDEVPAKLRHEWIPKFDTVLGEKKAAIPVGTTVQNVVFSFVTTAGDNVSAVLGTIPESATMVLAGTVLLLLARLGRRWIRQPTSEAELGLACLTATQHKTNRSSHSGIVGHLAVFLRTYKKRSEDIKAERMRLRLIR